MEQGKLQDHGWVSASHTGMVSLTVEFPDGRMGWPVQVSPRVSDETKERIRQLIMEDLSKEV